MPFTVPHLYIAVIGNSYTETEHWQFGLRATRLGSETDMKVVAGSLQGAFNTWWTNTVGSAFKPVDTHSLAELKVMNLNEDGIQYVNVPSGSYFWVPPVVGTGPPPAGLAPQNTCAVTLRTALPRGLGSTGRCFLPPNRNLLPGPDGRITAAAAKELADTFKTLINAINNNANIGDVSVMSRGKAERGPDLPNGKPTYTYPNPGVTNTVTGVSCGRVVDTQRRRRRSLLEAPVAATT